MTQCNSQLNLLALGLVSHKLLFFSLNYVPASARDELLDALLRQSVLGPASESSDCGTGATSLSNKVGTASSLSLLHFCTPICAHWGHSIVLWFSVHSSPTSVVKYRVLGKFEQTYIIAIRIRPSCSNTALHHDSFSKRRDSCQCTKNYLNIPPPRDVT